MKLKIILGIIIPLIIVITLTILGSLNIGFSVKKEFIDKLTFKDIFTENYQLRESIKIADITLENDYFLGRRYELPRLGICLDDKEGALQRINAGVLQYGEGDYDYEREDFLYETAYRTYPYYYGYNEARNIQIKANGKKSVRVFLQPSYEFNYENYTQLLERYGDYNSLLVFEMGNKYKSYYYCSDIDQETLDKAIIIPIEK